RGGHVHRSNLIGGDGLLYGRPGVWWPPRKDTATEGVEDAAAGVRRADAQVDRQCAARRARGGRRPSRLGGSWPHRGQSVTLACRLIESNYEKFSLRGN